jgi:hypothetical protein
MKTLRVIVLSLIVSMLGAVQARSEEERALQPEDLVDIRGVEDVRISPDGHTVAFVITEPADPKKFDKPRDTNIWMAPTDASQRGLS